MTITIIVIVTITLAMTAMRKSNPEMPGRLSRRPATSAARAFRGLSQETTKHYSFTEGCVGSLGNFC